MSVASSEARAAAATERLEEQLRGKARAESEAEVRGFWLLSLWSLVCCSCSSSSLLYRTEYVAIVVC